MGDDRPVPAKPRGRRKPLRTPFYEEEWISAANTYQNRYKSRTWSLEEANPIEAHEQVLLGLPQETHRHDYPYYIFASEPVGSANPATVKVSLLFCVGDQMNRAGLRTFFSERKDAVLITVPGWEPDDEDADEKEVAKPYGIGITDEQIKRLVRKAGLSGKPEIHVVAAYSTGYRGMISSVNTGNITVKNVRNMVFYDCLYEADDYFPLGREEWNKLPKVERTADKLDAVRTKGAVAKVLKDTGAHGKPAKIVIYDVTDNGTPHPLALSGHTVIDLKSRGDALEALQIARLIDEGAKDQFFRRKVIPSALGKLIPPPVRGSLVADGAIRQNGGPRRKAIASQQSLADWREAHSADVAAVRSSGARVWALGRVFTDELMGWEPDKSDPNAVAGEMRHDQFLPEFASEFLTPP